MSDTRPMLFAADLPIEHADAWRDLGQRSGANPQWTPLDLKIFYVFGVMHDIFESVEWLLRAPKAWPVTYISAVGVFASGIELLGRCLNGSVGTSYPVENLRSGLIWLLEAEARRTGRTALRDQGIITRTTWGIYGVEDIIAMRHFAAHGQAMAHELGIIDPYFLEHLPRLIGSTLQVYWNDLEQRVILCQHMATADVIPLGMRADPLRKMFFFIQEKNKSIRDIFRAFNWTVENPYGENMPTDDQNGEDEV